MDDFRIDERALSENLRFATRQANADLDAVTQRAQDGVGLTPNDMAVLWTAPALHTETLYELAREARRIRPARLETFSPLYMTNTCDGECRLCGMRRDNPALVRQTATLEEVKEQLRILSQRGVRAVALVTGEYRAATRDWAMQYINQALLAALEMGFHHVLTNVGSLADEELHKLLSGVPRAPDGTVAVRLTMSTFQETYSRATYAKFTGSDPGNPRADFDRRLTNFDRAFRAGIRSANPGILVGLSRDLGYEMVALALHARHLLARGMDVYLSVPRLRQIAGQKTECGATNEDFVRLVAVLSLALPACKLVITTRENTAMQHKLAPIVNVISPGSSAVAPYTRTSTRFLLETSQFEVLDQRPLEDILREHLVHSGTIENFNPAH